MRTAWPLSSRAFGSVRLPFTRTSPLRMMRWMWLNDRPGKRASKKRSTRMPDSSGVTVTVCTAAENCAALALASASGGAGAGWRSTEPPALPLGRDRPALPRAYRKKAGAGAVALRRARPLPARLPGHDALGSSLGRPRRLAPLFAIALAIRVARARALLAAARLTWSVSAPHSPPRSLRNLAQYSSRFLISRSKPRSGGL